MPLGRYALPVWADAENDAVTPQLFPREPRRLRQPTKDVMRDQLAIAADRIIELSEENLALRDAIDRSTEHLRGALAPEGGLYGSG